jgi:hypothetical protein
MQPDAHGIALHRVQVAASSLNLLDVDTVPPQVARRIASLRTEANMLVAELAGPRVTYRRGAIVVHGNYIADLSTTTTVAIRGADGYVQQLSTVGKFDLRWRSTMPLRAVRTAAA